MATPPTQFGTEAQKQEYLVPAIQGKKIACLGITEPTPAPTSRASARAPSATATSG